MQRKTPVALRRHLANPIWELLSGGAARCMQKKLVEAVGFEPTDRLTRPTSSFQNWRVRPLRHASVDTVSLAVPTSAYYGAGSKNRTRDHFLTKEPLYQLSYAGGIVSNTLGWPQRQAFQSVTCVWCPRRGLNARPLPYQGSALPLSYAGGNSCKTGAGSKTRTRDPFITNETLYPTELCRRNR
jgi:hypothetical protein